VIPPGYSQLDYGVGNGATLTLADGSDPTSTFYVVSLTGGGSLVNNTSITTTGTAIAGDGFAQGALVNFTNNGSITATLSGSVAIQQGVYQIGNITNTGTITTSGGGAINTGPNYALTNSGTITVNGFTGDAVYAFDTNFQNSGTIQSNQGVGAYLYGNQGTPVSNSGTIFGELVGAQLLGDTLTNSGTITSPGTAV
jgi:hypothetical protein